MTLDVRHYGDRLVVEVTENGAGKPDRELEAMLTDLTDRIGALDGQLHVGHIPGGGVTIRAEMPCGS